MKKQKEVAVVEKVETKVVDEPGGLITLLGKRVLLICSGYFYEGRLVGVNDTDVELAEAKLVYDTGPWDASTWTDVQDMSKLKSFFVRTAAIESYGELVTK